MVGGTGSGRGGVAHQNRFTATLAVGPRKNAAKVPEKLLRSRWIAMRVTFTSILTKVEKSRWRRQKRNLACSGATLLGTTDNLNFGPAQSRNLLSASGVGARPGGGLSRLQRPGVQAGTSVFIIKIRMAQLIRHRRWQWWGSSRSRACHDAMVQGSRVTPLFCSAPLWMRAMRCKGLAVLRGCGLRRD